jgi:putative nucleotidyltransferase with HDIG domain
VSASEAAAIRAGRPWIVKNLRPLPVIAVRLMRLVSTDDVIFRTVADLIRTDPAFSAEVLRLANSPLLGCRGTISGMLHAMAILGLDRIKGLVMTVALRDFLAGALQNPVLTRCWRHSLASALLCEELAVACWLDKDKGYTAGLLHDLGRLALLATCPEDYVALLEDADKFGAEEFDLLQSERDRFEADHAQVGCWLAQDWEFPPEYREIAGGHHRKPAADRFDLLTAVQLGCRIADMLGFQVAGPAPLTSLDDLKQEFPGCAWGRMKSDHDLFLAIAGKINALECSLI